MQISTKEKTKDTAISSAFLKGDTKEHILMFFGEENLIKTSVKDLKIKFEVDTTPPEGARFETKYKLLPSPHEVCLYDEASLMAGKIHAILCRNWNYRTKGRDLYDYIFFLSQKTTVNLELLKFKLVASGALNENGNFDVDVLKEMLYKKFEEINYKDAKEDVFPFIEDRASIEVWNETFFKEITKELVVLPFDYK